MPSLVKETKVGQRNLTSGGLMVRERLIAFRLVFVVLGRETDNDPKMPAQDWEVVRSRAMQHFPDHGVR
jgi:hypothetical protein